VLVNGDHSEIWRTSGLDPRSLTVSYIHNNNNNNNRISIAPYTMILMKLSLERI